MLDLNSQELHYYKRELISLELKQELSNLRASGHVSELVDSSLVNDDYPFLRYLSQHFLIDFPLLKNANDKEFWKKLQTFLDEYNKLKFDRYVPDSATDSQHRILFYKLEKMMTISLAASIKTTQGNEESIKVDITSNDLVSKFKATQLEDNPQDRRLDINICTVRDISEKHTLREVTHSEFIIQTNFTKTDTVFVARRHGQFRQLREDLKTVFPTLELPSVPSKTRDSSYANLYREKDRLSLRSFLHRLLIFDEVCTSDVLKSFLSGNPITLTETERDDSEQRQKRDHARMEEERRFKEQVDSKITELDGLLSMLKTKIMKPNGLMEIFDVIKTTETIDKLPVELQKALDWGSVNLAFVLHTHFVASDRSVENIASLKRTHSLIPYRTMAQMLKLSNPFAMVKGVLDLFLAQPFGGKSLMQRIILVNMNDESKEMQKDIEELQVKINDPDLCKKVQNTINSDMPPGLVFSGNNIKDTLEMLKNPRIEPILTPQQIMNVAFANQPGKEEARQLVTQLYDLWVLYARKQEKEVLMSLMFQGVTGEIIKDLFAIFYTPLAQVYKSANIGDTIGHISGFIDDLLKVIDGLDAENTTNTTQPFIDLVQRHEQEFYTFVHNVHAQDKGKLFDSLILYVDSILNFIATGIPTRIDMEKITTESGIGPADYPALKKEIQSICMYHLARKERHLERKRQKLMSTTEQETTIDFLPDDNDFKGALDDFSEIEENDWDQSTDNLAHEMTLKSPTLEIIPTILPCFVKHVKHVLNQ